MSTAHQVETLSGYWGKQVANWQQTTQSQSAYCKQHDLNYHRFTYWQRKLFIQTRQSTQRSGFVPVKSGSPIETAKANEIEPYDYIHYVLQHIGSAKTVEDIGALLSRQVKSVMKNKTL